MKKSFRYLIYLLGIIILTLGFLISYVGYYLPNAEAAPDIKVKATPEMVERGKYLANHVMLCMDCHAVRDFSLFAGPPTPGTHGGGGDIFDQNMGFPGRFVSRNLTPFGLADWTDGEIFRAITTGVSRDGSALFPVMPYPHYSKLAEDDIYAVIAYLRNLEPIENELESSKPDFPVSLLINTMPVKAEFQPRPSPDNTVEYGKYMVTAAACTDCHTRMENGAFVGQPFAGGNEYRLPDGSVVRSSNLTPHETGIKNMTKDQFVMRFKVFADSSYVPRKVGSGQFQTLMPWQMYGGMNEQDLEAIYDYLRTLEPADNRVQLFTAVSGE
ncbi:c-type cytochrome [Rhodohalobacter sp. 8-1]|uniref:c-type cytochrome n=1 Tax=Rhodohalobacter sp. 8-1 TaxID=3131972 RepID=UPI0030EDB7A3